jgi:flagellar protein FliO/FliZ
METFFGIELGSASKVIIGLILVLALIVIAAWLIRQFGSARIALSGGGRNRQQRLSVLDSAEIDGQRRLVLIRRDNVEHLILIGGPTDVVVEPNIVRAAPASGNARPAARPGGFEDEDASIIPEPAPGEPERAPAAARSSEPPRTMPRPAPQRIDPQYADMAQRLEQALRKPAGELDVPRAPAPAPAAPAPRAPEPRILEPRPAVAPVPRAPAPRAPEPRAEPIVTPPPRPVQPVQIAQPAQGQQSAADVFGSLEEEMASLLRPGAKKENK